MKLNAATAMFPGETFEMALSLLSTGTVTDAGMPVSMDHIQLCPQSHGKLSKQRLSGMQATYPDSCFRLHATCRLSVNGYRRYEASTPAAIGRSYFLEMAELSQWIQAPAYSLHAGRRGEATLKEMIRNVRDIQDLFDCPVAVEGLYPTKGDTLLVSTWDEYRMLMESGLFYALDMSHLNIVATRLRTWDFGLVTALLENPNCLEVHVSSNNGYSDSHSPVGSQHKPCWWPYLDRAGPNAVIFTESNQRRHGKMGVAA